MLAMMIFMVPHTWGNSQNVPSIATYIMFSAYKTLSYYGYLEIAIRTKHMEAY